jgi:hypothetical protein
VLLIFALCELAVRLTLFPINIPRTRFFEPSYAQKQPLVDAGPVKLS